MQHVELVGPAARFSGPQRGGAKNSAGGNCFVSCRFGLRYLAGAGKRHPSALSSPTSAHTNCKASGVMGVMKSVTSLCFRGSDRKDQTPWTVKKQANVQLDGGGGGTVWQGHKQ